MMFANMAAELTILLDGDDTLWKTQEIYDEAKLTFASLLRENGLAETDDKIISKLDRIDSCRVALRGLTIQRFTESMLILYGYFCGEKDLPYQSEIEKEIVNICKTIRRPPELFDDVLEALERLSKEFRLVLFTAGHSATQKRKISSLKLDLTSYFEEVRFVGVKNERRLQQELLSMKLNPSDVWSIGNSLRSDILPAIAVGASAVLINRGTWVYDTDIPNLQDKHIQFWKAESLLKAAELILSR
jgi:putative hydrolase of the HAD superfamily